MGKFQDNTFTIYDAMAKKGVFSSNPANPQSFDPTSGEGLYRGPVPFPKMVYHPKGERRVTVPAEIVNGPYGPTRNSEQTALISKVVNNEEELKIALAEGWHTHPADAVEASLTAEDRARGAKAPDKGPSEMLRKAEAEGKQKDETIAELQKQLEDMKKELGAKPQKLGLSS
jgi:hypothetical protein